MPPKIDWSRLNIVPDYDAQEWWEATKEGRLMVRSCNECGHKWWPPSAIGCANCGNLENVGFAESKGPGTVHSFIVVTQPILSPFMEAVPYVGAMIELDDVKTIDGNPVKLQGVVDEGEDQVGINSRVELYFDKIADDGRQVPRWKLAATQPDNVWLFPGP